MVSYNTIWFTFPLCIFNGFINDVVMVMIEGLITTNLSTYS